MHSKWLDVGTDLAAFHFQMRRYKRPPSFGENPAVKYIERERVRLNQTANQEYQQMLEMGEEKSSAMPSKFLTFFKRREKQSAQSDLNYGQIVGSATKAFCPTSKIISTPILNGGMESKQPALFLQETAHLLSLLSAVAMSTLRNDLEEAESPLATFVPGVPWPHVDPDKYAADVRKDWYRSTHRSWTIIRYLLGISRSEKDRTLYNAARPFKVIGGPSDAEVEMLRAARGPFAKVALCTMWLQEFIIREHMAGSTGGIGDPIISRIFQFISDGMIGYNQARKVAYIPFPFPHSQIVSLFVLVTIVYIPLLMLTYVTNLYFGVILNLLTVLCFSGLHEVARELENPFRNVPNDIPANNFQAQFNEALLTIYSGYHPDAFWEVAQVQVNLPAASE